MFNWYIPRELKVTKWVIIGVVLLDQILAAVGIIALLLYFGVIS